MEKALGDVLREEGFRKEGQSKWIRRVGETVQVAYLQRSQFAHEYFIEAGICQEKDIPAGRKPDVVYCRFEDRARIEHIIEELEKARRNEDETSIKEKKDKVITALDFEAPGARKSTPGEYFVPSVSMEQADTNIETIQKTVKEYVPEWFEKRFQRSH